MILACSETGRHMSICIFLLIAYFIPSVYTGPKVLPSYSATTMEVNPSRSIIHNLSLYYNTLCLSFSRASFMSCSGGKPLMIIQSLLTHQLFGPLGTITSEKGLVQICKAKFQVIKLDSLSTQQSAMTKMAMNQIN